ncbi:MAG: DUF2330 domain-containing protein [Sandaracinaceae bacterium]|nr:DUF2330 domain-containing protein [Sandaracinaceae bacterium]
MRSSSLVLALLLAAPAPALACGGFFCGQQPVDQQAERILFAVGDDHTDMVVQISYRGEASEFAWVLPIGFVPETSDLGTFSPLALTQLDANTAPVFVRPDDFECGGVLLNGGGSDADTPGVTVHLTDVVGPYEVAVIEGADAGELITWLRDHHFRVTDAMLPYIDAYVSEGMKLLALRLVADRGIEDIEPFRIRMPGRTPSIPIRLTAIAAEPDMGILVFVFADRRYGPGNWSELEIDGATLRFASHAWPAETDYLARVARDADALDGRAFVTELAGPTAPLLEVLRRVTPTTPEQERARRELDALLTEHPYMTRMYARLSADEMTVDPLFAPHPGPDIAREVYLARFVDGRDMCAGEGLGPCDFALCGNGACAVVTADGFPYQLAACDCAEGTVARASFDALGQMSVVCVDPRASVIGPGDTNGPGSEPLGDPCSVYDCGLGRCVPVNMTPTCDCDEGAVAVGLRGTMGERITRCVMPDDTVVVPPPPPPPPPPPFDAGTPGATSPDPLPARGGPFAPGGGGCACRAVPAAPGAPWLLALAALAIVRSRAR